MKSRRLWSGPLPSRGDFAYREGLLWLMEKVVGASPTTVAAAERCCTTSRGECGRVTLVHGTRSPRRRVVKLTRKIIFAILIGLSLFGAASAVAVASHASAATAIEY
jgi:hypothetical protein